MKITETLVTPVSYVCDVLVVGGGFGGIAAAAAAAEEGKNVILAERVFMLGGLGTAGLVNCYLPLCDGLGHQVSFGLAERLLRLSLEHCPYEHSKGYDNWIASDDPAKRTENTPRFCVDFNPQLFAISAEKFLLSLGVKILYGTVAVGAKVEGSKIVALFMENKSGRFAVAAKSFVDASGDADLAKFSGAPTELFGQGNVLSAWYFDNDNGGYRRNILGCCDIPENEKGENNAPDYLVARRFAGIDGDEISEFVQMSHSSTLNDYLHRKKECPDLEVTTLATIPQLRMTRRVAGEYTLDTDEMHTFFPDSCGMVSDWKKRGPVYEVPFRTLYSAKIRNLVFAGRITSVTDAMWDIMRVIPCCAVTGEAAGVAAAMTDDFPTIDMNDFQSRLTARGVILHEKELKM